MHFYLISIPSGAIKSFAPAINQRIYTRISIPSGAIKRQEMGRKPA